MSVAVCIYTGGHISRSTQFFSLTFCSVQPKLLVLQKICKIVGARSYEYPRDPAKQQVHARCPETRNLPDIVSTLKNVCADDVPTDDENDMDTFSYKVEFIYKIFICSLEIF